jgi:hypothetical protein
MQSLQNFTLVFGACKNNWNYGKQCAKSAEFLLTLEDGTERLS